MNTKQDYLNVLKDNPQEGKKQLQALLDSRFIWKDIQVLESKEIGVEDETHRILEDEEDFIQQEWLQDDNAELFRLGFTVEEIQELL